MIGAQRSGVLGFGLEEFSQRHIDGQSLKIVLLKKAHSPLGATEDAAERVLTVRRDDLVHERVKCGLESRQLVLKGRPGKFGQILVLYAAHTILSSIGLRTSDGRPRGSGVHRTLRPALVALLPLTLAACEADEVAARATLKDLGFHGIAFERAPMFGRPCSWGEPYAVRFRATREDGSTASGTMCSADEATEDARLLPDAEGRR